MSEESANNAEKKTEETVTAETPLENNVAEAPAQPASEEELVKEIKDEDVAHIVTGLLRGQQIASVYIDARSGGVFLGGEARITGDVVGGERIHKTMFTGPVSGPVHTGSGDIYYGKTQREGTSIGVGRVLVTNLTKTRSLHSSSNLCSVSKSFSRKAHTYLVGTSPLGQVDHRPSPALSVAR